MKKLVICTIGTSIVNSCSVDMEIMQKNLEWDSNADELKKQITESLMQLGMDMETEKNRRRISAEMNALDRIGISPNDVIVLLVSDNAQGRVCSEVLKEVIMEAYGLGAPQVEIKRIVGLQVHNADRLRKEGLQNFVKVVAGDYLANPDKMYSYDIILNPVGGYKIIVPFLTILGMLYGKRTVYIFEHSNNLINLPPIPVAFDLDIYERAKPAIDYIEKETAVPEQAFFSKISGYSPEEKDIFSAFIEPAEEGNVTLSPLAFCLKSGREKVQEIRVTKEVDAVVKKNNSISCLALKRMLSNLGDPLWQTNHIHIWDNTDLLVIKRSSTAERLAGFRRDGIFHVTHAFTDHEEYERTLGKYKSSDFRETEFISWENDEYLGVPSEDRDALVEERDKFLIENNRLKKEIKDSSAREEDLKMIHNLNQEKNQLEKVSVTKEKEIKFLNETLAVKDAEIESLKSSCSKLILQKEDLQIKLEQAEEKIVALKDINGHSIMAMLKKLFRRMQ